MNPIEKKDVNPSVSFRVEDRVAWITIDRPQRMNALACSTFERMSEICLECDSDDDIRVIVFVGAGEKAFSAGVDLKESTSSQSMTHPMRDIGRNLNEIVLEMETPTIAAINGVAAGGGCELALACDIRIASETATIGLPEARVGMGANFGSVILPQLIGRGLALELLFTGELIGMQRAKEIGLVNRVFAPSLLRQSAHDLAVQIAENAPLSVQRMKSMALRSWGLPPAAGLRLSARTDPYNSEDRIEGGRAFMEKRKPVFKGR